MLLKTTEEKASRIRRLNIFTAIFLVMTFAFILGTPTAYADGGFDIIRMMASQIVNGVFSPALKMLVDPTTEFGSFYAQVKSARFTGKLAMVGDLYNGLKWCAALGLFVVAFVKFFQEMERGRDQWDVLGNLLLNIGVTGAFIINMDYFMNIAVKLGDIFVQITIDKMNITLDAEAQAENVDTFLISLTGKSSGWDPIAWIKAFASMVFPWLVSWAIEIVLQATVLQTIIEIAIRRAFAPIAMIDIFSEGWRSPGFAWLKKIVSTFLKIAVILVALVIVQKIQSGLTSGNPDTEAMNPFAYAGRMLIVDFTGFALVHSAGQYIEGLLQ